MDKRINVTPHLLSLGDVGVVVLVGVAAGVETEGDSGIDSGLWRRLDGVVSSSVGFTLDGLSSVDGLLLLLEV